MIFDEQYSGAFCKKELEQVLFNPEKKSVFSSFQDNLFIVECCPDER